MAMAVSSTYTSNSIILYSNSNSCFPYLESLTIHLHNGVGIRRSSRICRRFGAVSSSHSNPKILKSNRRTRFGQRLSPYDSDDENESIDFNYDDDDWLSDDPGPGFDDNKLKRKSQLAINGNGDRGSVFSRMSRKKKTANGNGKVILDRNNHAGKDKDAGKSSKNRYRRLLEEVDVDDKWFPLLDYLATFGLKDSHFVQMYGRHMPSLQINVTAAQERLDFLMSVGVKSKDIKKILMRQPQILQYTVESNLKSHVAFLVSLGIQDSRIGQDWIRSSYGASVILIEHSWTIIVLILALILVITHQETVPKVAAFEV